MTNTCTHGRDYQEHDEVIDICAYAEDKEILDAKASIREKLVSHGICPAHLEEQKALFRKYKKHDTTNSLTRSSKEVKGSGME